MTGVDALGYLGLIADDFDRWEVFATQVLGMQTERANGRLLLRMDDRAYRISVTASGSAEPAAFAGGLAHLGFEVGGPRQLDEVECSLQAKGVATERATDADCAERKVRQLVRCVDPAGHSLEIYWGQEVATAPFRSPAGRRFVTGGLGFGHIVLIVAPDTLPACLEFYRSELGFRDSDVIDIEGTEVTFLHCNERHHTVALAAGNEEHRGLNHFMAEVDQIDDVGIAADAAARLGVQQTTIGMHTNDRMLSFYAMTPSGCEVEYGFGGRIVSDPYTQGFYTAPSIWGHAHVKG
jgi:2,3-dihydroxybiphenyl 1,2-dioxygenase